ncbi:uncharacterized protein LOC101852434 [Aplysia californica]|uniref:Uncharacterized protein LOC101852434 n=1 Tax=Aplysia californica TaxID=6500 RepID=A0ABM1A9A2_APLCA|nr:uncharacterized protein LOC101852434 [Aplysia californica]XP_012943268.1 uncharacterized protein LOC101852434 [Aplysia californica]XP_012943269.1 uncharacterized protein LOC101852434 [Aplysia californica]
MVFLPDVVDSSVGASHPSTKVSPEAVKPGTPEKAAGALSKNGPLFKERDGQLLGKRGEFSGTLKSPDVHSDETQSETMGYLPSQGLGPSGSALNLVLTPEDGESSTGLKQFGASELLSDEDETRNDEDDGDDDDDDVDDDENNDQNVSMSEVFSNPDDDGSDFPCDDLDLNDEDEDDEDDNIDDTEGDKTKLTYPTDTGYAWVVVLAVFCIQFLFVGYLKSLGIFLVEFQEKFNSTSSMTSLVVGVMEAIASLFSFLVMGLMFKFAYPRTVCLIGSVIFTAAIIGNSLIERFELLCLTQGCLFGLSIALLYGPSLFVLMQYFERRRAFATALGTCGTSFGGVVLPLLIRYLLDEYSLRGGTLMTAGVLMHSIAFSAMLRPIEKNEMVLKIPESKKSPQNVRSGVRKELGTFEKLRQRFRGLEGESSELDKKSECSRSFRGSHNSINQRNGHLKFDPKKITNIAPFSSKLEICEEGVPLKIEQNIIVGSHGDLVVVPVGNGITSSSVSLVNGSQESLVASNNDFHAKLTEINNQNGSLVSIVNQNGSVVVSPVTESSYSNNHLAAPAVTFPRRWNDSLATENTPSLYDVESMAYTDIGSKYSHSKRQLSRSTASIFCSTSTLNTNFADLISIEQDTYFKQTQLDDTAKPQTFFRKFCFSLLNNPLLKSTSFWVLVVFYFSATIGQAVPQMYIPALAKEKGLTPSQSAMLISLMNTLDIPCRIVVGVLVNCGFVSPSKACILPMFVIGMVGQMTAFFNSYESMLAMAVMYGLFMGVYFAMQSLVVIEALGMKNFTSAIGFYYLIMGLAGAVSYPISGALRDLTGSYVSAYTYLATMELVAMLQLIVLQFTTRFDKRRGIINTDEDDSTEGEQLKENGN